MTVELPVVVGVDGSEAGLRAVDWAVDEAALRGAPLRLVYASLWERYEGAHLARDLGEPGGRVRAEDVVASAARRAAGRRSEVKVTTAVVSEEPEYTLVRESRNAALLVTGTRGRGGMTEALLGSVSLTVAGHAHCPVVVVRGSHDNRAVPATHGRVVVGVGEPPVASAAVRFAVEEARRRGAALSAVRAWRHPVREAPGHRAPDSVRGGSGPSYEREAVEALAEALRDVPAGVEVLRSTVEGPARSALVDASHDADLLVLGARRRHRHFGLQLGRVAHGVLHHSACPVAVVPEYV
ncbi:universal stress protein [Streptomyces sp. NPDC058739]|uniref:universal stress protein n=1 Tax=Streptomyces sp. NPDC058739 TaxID=3346618 RepID=UPI00368F7673